MKFLEWVYSEKVETAPIQWVEKGQNDWSAYFSILEINS